MNECDYKMLIRSTGTVRQLLYLNVQQELPNYGTASHWFMS